MIRIYSIINAFVDLLLLYNLFSPATIVKLKSDCLYMDKSSVAFSIPLTAIAWVIVLLLSFIATLVVPITKFPSSSIIFAFIIAFLLLFRYCGWSITCVLCFSSVSVVFVYILLYVLSIATAVNV